jgi:hypothetical protein
VYVHILLHTLARSGMKTIFFSMYIYIEMNVDLNTRVLADSTIERRKTERRMTEHQMTEGRKTEQRMTEHRMTKCQIGHNVE